MAIPQTFDEAFERTKQLVSIFSENEGKYVSYELYELTPEEIAIVEEGVR